MRSDWKYIIGNVCDVGDGAHSKVKRLQKGILYITSKNIGQGSLIKLDEAEYISESDYEKLFPIKSKSTRHPFPGDILIGIIGTFGNSYIYTSDDNFGFSSSIGILRPNSELIDSKYLYYVINSKKFQAYNKLYNTGSVQGYTNMSTVRNLPIPLQKLPTQKKIAYILSTLDDKIELNRKMNETLEGMAQALFKSWFVDFDPVHARAKATSDAELEAAAGELGISREVLELFPSTFVESEMGMVPEGWEHDTLGSFVEILDFKRIPLAKNERAKRQGNIPYYGATSIMDYIDDFIFDEPLTLLGEDGSVVRDDGTPFMQYIWGKAWVNNHAHVIKSKSTLSTEAIYVALQKQNVTMFVTGAVQPKINQTNLKRIPIIKPSGNLHEVYSEIIAPMFSKIRQLTDETETLTKTRDTLLPKLLSGELDMSEIDIEGDV